jgi:hypothetical protein
MSEMDKVDISSCGKCFRFFQSIFNARQDLYVRDNPGSKKEVGGEELLSTILDQYTETVCDAVEIALYKTRGKVKKILKVIYAQSKISFRRGTGNGFTVCFQYGLKLNTLEITDDIWILMDCDTSTSVGQLVTYETIDLDVSMGNMSIDRSLEMCPGFWKHEYSDLYGGDIKVIAKYLNIGQQFELKSKGVRVEMINDFFSPFRLHALSCNGCLGNNSRSITQDRINIFICGFCHAIRNASALRRQIKIANDIKMDIDNNTFFANDGVIVSKLKIESLSRSNAIDLLKRMTLGIKINIFIWL